MLAAIHFTISGMQRNKQTLFFIFKIYINNIYFSDTNIQLIHTLRYNADNQENQKHDLLSKKRTQKFCSVFYNRYVYTDTSPCTTLAY